MELPVPLSPLVFASYSCFLFLFPVVFFSFEVAFENCKCRSWCRPDDLVSSYQRRHHGEDWGGHVLPNVFQDRFFNSSKSEEKYLGGGGYDGGT